MRVSRNDSRACPNDLAWAMPPGNASTSRCENRSEDAMEYTVEQVDQVGEGLLALPAVEPSKRKLDKQAAVSATEGPDRDRPAAGLHPRTDRPEHVGAGHPDNDADPQELPAAGQEAE